MAGEEINIGTGVVANGQKNEEAKLANEEVDELQKRLDNLNK